ncbi:MAG: SoxR reducing system RseC family protein [Pseudomonadota bacterium]|nr:transcriptional regulator [Pseudomonadales bacterium]MDY6921114.1 SoxR reducing system RseC family protein [Pseudomonadota bacterium]
MIEENGRVVAVNPGLAWVETTRHSACDSCSAKSGCGHSALAKLGQNAVHLEARCDIEVTVGDQVVVGVPEEIMLKSSLLAYLMPLVAMLIAVLAADSLWQQDLITALAGLLGLGAGFVVLRWHFHRNRHDQRYQPVVLRRLGGVACGQFPAA